MTGPHGSHTPNHYQNTEAIGTVREGSHLIDVPENIQQIASVLGRALEKDANIRGSFQKELDVLTSKTLENHELYITLIDHLYNIHKNEVLSLTGTKRTKRILSFNALITKLTMQFSEQHGYSELKTQLETRIDTLKRQTDAITKRTQLELAKIAPIE